MTQRPRRGPTGALWGACLTDGQGRSPVTSGALLELAHLSLLITTPTRRADDILLSVLASATFRFALAAFPVRFRWALSLVLVHAFVNASGIFLEAEMPFAGDVGIHAAFVLVGVLLLRTVPRGLATRRGDHASMSESTEARSPRV